MIPVDIKEVYRYISILGGGSDKDRENEVLRPAVDEALYALQKAAVPRHTYACFPLEISGDDILIGTMRVKSKNLATNLSGCQEAYLMAVTIGPGVDALIRRTSVESAAKAVIMQAAAAAMVESVADSINDKIKEEVSLSGKKTKPRFSPGYGDFSLSHQLDFQRILDLPKSIGVSVMESLLMAPSKSVTAVIGILEG